MTEHSRESTQILLNFRILLPASTGSLLECDFNDSLTEKSLSIKNSSKCTTYSPRSVTTLLQVNRTKQTRGQFKSSCPISFHSQVFMSKQSWKRSQKNKLWKHFSNLIEILQGSQSRHCCSPLSSKTVIQLQKWCYSNLTVLAIYLRNLLPNYAVCLINTFFVLSLGDIIF